MLANLAHLAHLADHTLVPGVVLGTVEGTLLIRIAAVDWRETGTAYLELGELVKVDFNSVIGIPLALRLGLLGL